MASERRDGLESALQIEIGKWLVVVYREFEDDGFVITAFARQKEGSVVTINLEEYLKFLPTVSQTPEQNVWLSYDAEADVLYVNFKRPSEATDSELTNEDVIIRYDGDNIVDLTVLHASKRGQLPAD